MFKTEKNIYLLETEVKPNRYATYVMLFSAVGILFCWVLNEIGLFRVGIWEMRIGSIIPLVAVLIPLGMLLSKGGYTGMPGMKYVVMSAAIVFTLSTTTLLTFHTTIMLLFPVFVAMLYRSKRLGIIAFFSSVISTIITPILGYVLQTWDIELFKELILIGTNGTAEVVGAAPGVTMISVMKILLYLVVPRLIMVGSCSLLMFYIISVGMDHVNAQIELNQLNHRDALTGLYNRNYLNEVLQDYSFCGNCAVIFFDVNNLKTVNDRLGHEGGDLLLSRCAKCLLEVCDEERAGAFRIGGDEFLMIIADIDDHGVQDYLTRVDQALMRANSEKEIRDAGLECSMASGYVIDQFAHLDKMIRTADANMYNNKKASKRAQQIQAQMPVPAAENPGGISEAQVLRDALPALARHEFIVYYQPQYNMTTGMLVGVEALARWKHPDFGVLAPGAFIPVFERNGLISRLDLEIFEIVCRFLRNCMDQEIHLVPVSVNLTRADVYSEEFLRHMEELRQQYRIPTDYIHLEIVESVASNGGAQARAVVDRLHSIGYLVEMDDFGSGYSSLNVLKDIPYDILKLDMNFLSEDLSGRGGTIISSIVRMATWLNMPVIAEGVETQQQAEFMKSIGCDYVQGYLYSRPIPELDYLALLQNTAIGLTSASLKLKNAVNPVSFWDYRSIETLVFNNFVGGAAVFRYGADGTIECLRVNRKYIEELRMNMTEEDVIRTDFCTGMDEGDEVAYKAMLERAIRTEEEQVCETWRAVQSDCCGDEKLCIRTQVTLIGKSEGEYIFFASIRNVTDDKQRAAENRNYERQFKNVTEQANIYYWEYTVATKEMRPCFRCMRDLGLPPLVTNYPEPAIEQGIFPQDYAEMYRDWHRRIAAGVPHLEAVIPLTVGRVPFHVRYTTEFDELGRPVKAYGSATLVTPEEQNGNQD